MSATRMIGHLEFGQPDTPIEITALRALDYFRHQYQSEPTRLLVHPDAALGRAEIEKLGLELVFTNTMLPNQCWIGAPKVASAAAESGRVKRKPTMQEIKQKHNPAPIPVVPVPAPAPPCIRIVDTPESTALARALAGMKALPAPKPVLMLPAPKLQPVTSAAGAPPLKQLNPAYIEAFRAAHADLHIASQAVRWMPVVKRLIDQGTPDQWLAPVLPREAAPICISSMGDPSDVLKQIAKQKAVNTALRVPAAVQS